MDTAESWNSAAVAFTCSEAPSGCITKCDKEQRENGKNKRSGQGDG